jgi:hypothetical protein
MSMPATDIDTLVVLNDSTLERLIRARGDAVDSEVERLILHAQPLIAEILTRYSRGRMAFPRHDADDVHGAINLRLLAKLRAIARSEEDAIRDFEKYVATITYNAINDSLRKSFPARARFKNRIRYVLTHDDRLGLWLKSGMLIAGLRGSSGAANVLSNVPHIASGGAIRLTAGSDRPGDVLAELFTQLQRPVQFDPLIDFLAERWKISESPAIDLENQMTPPGADLDTRHYLAALWSEIRELRPLQRKALLLNLRGSDTVNVIPLIVLTGTASHEDVAAALEIAPDELAALWNDLPLDDQRIAAQLQLTRQQVINLRKAARARLARRMSAKRTS